MRKAPLLYLSGTVYAVLLLWVLLYSNYVRKTADFGKDEGTEEFSLDLEEKLRLFDDKKKVNRYFFKYALPCTISPTDRVIICFWICFLGSVIILQYYIFTWAKNDLVPVTEWVHAHGATTLDLIIPDVPIEVNPTPTKLNKRKIQESCTTTYISHKQAGLR